MINVHKDATKPDYMKWKSGKNYPKSVVITDFGISTLIKVSEYKTCWASRNGIGSVCWAPPEQWLGQCMPW